MSSEKNVQGKIYGNDSILISELIGRTFNNPLDEYPFERFAEVFAGGPSKFILDVGAGRGRAAILVAQRFGAKVTAVEASAEMAQFAGQLVFEAQLENRVHVLHSDFFTANLGRKQFNVVMSFDVISYFQDKKTFFEKVVEVLPKGGTLLFSDYFCMNPSEPMVQALASAWEISIPGDFNFYPTILSQWGLSVDHFEDTTPRYLAHWTEIKRRCLEKKDELITKTSAAAVEAYLASIDTIISAVHSGKFGHLFCVATK